MKIAKKRKRGLSNIQIVVIALVIIIIVGILAYYLISSSRSTPTLTTTQQSTTSLTSPSTTNLKTYYIGVLLPLSGSLSSFGQAGEVVLSYGEQQVNQYLQQVNASFRIKLVIEDTQSNPTRALQDIQDLYSQGIKLVIGPSLSSEANAIKQFTDQHNMIVFADITSPFVPTTNGSIYTIIPTETDVGAVMANIIWTQGIRVVAVIWRGDSYGDGVFYSFNKSFTSLGGIVVPAVRYDPSAS
ncbi:MAG: penicillin-binding protein activator, partial [Sulfolobaceae archaeon]